MTEGSRGHFRGTSASNCFFSKNNKGGGKEKSCAGESPYKKRGGGEALNETFSVNGMNHRENRASSLLIKEENEDQRSLFIKDPVGPAVILGL